MSSPNMNNIIIIGCILVYVTVFLLRLDFDSIGQKFYQIVCIVSIKELFLYVNHCIISFEIEDIFFDFTTEHTPCFTIM